MVKKCHNCQILSNIVKNCQHGQKWSNNVKIQNCQKNQNCQNENQHFQQQKNVKNCQELSKSVNLCQNL